MKKTTKVLLLAVLMFGFRAGFGNALRGATAQETARINRAQLVSLEQTLDDRFRRLWPDNDVALFGPTRAVYVDGYGLVVTVEINAVKGPPIFMFHPNVTPEEVTQHHAKKVQRMPELKRAMQEAIAAAAAAMEPAPEDAQITLVAFIAKYPWEDLTGLPQRIMMQSTKKKLLDARGNAAALAGAIQMTEF